MTIFRDRQAQTEHILTFYTKFLEQLARNNLHNSFGNLLDLL